MAIIQSGFWDSQLLLVTFSEMICLNGFKIVSQVTGAFVLRLEPDVCGHLRVCVIKILHQLWILVVKFLERFLIKRVQQVVSALDIADRSCALLVILVALVFEQVLLGCSQD